MAESKAGTDAGRGAALPQAAASPPPASPPPVGRILEALLFIGGEPLTAEVARRAVRGLNEMQLREAVDELNGRYRREGRPYLVHARTAAGDGYVLELRPAFQGVVERLAGGVRVARLSPAAVDVLALVAYRQPATRAELESVRGSDCGSLVRQLIRRGLVAVVSRDQAGHGDVAYGTTPRFLELFGLRDLDELPRTEDLQRL